MTTLGLASLSPAAEIAAALVRGLCRVARLAGAEGAVRARGAVAGVGAGFALAAAGVRGLA